MPDVYLKPRNDRPYYESQLSHLKHTIETGLKVYKQNNYEEAAQLFERAVTTLTSMVEVCAKLATQSHQMSEPFKKARELSDLLTEFPEPPTEEGEK